MVHWRKISRGLLAEPVQIPLTADVCIWYRAAKSNIDVAFLGVPSCDEFW
ncbi:citrate lyase subunit alpha [Escherichia coli]